MFSLVLSCIFMMLVCSNVEGAIQADIGSIIGIIFFSYCTVLTLIIGIIMITSKK